MSDPATNQDDVFAKIDALLKKHQDGSASPLPPLDFPVLTEIIEEEVAIIPLLTEVVEVSPVLEDLPAQTEKIEEEAIPHAVAGEQELASIDHHIRAALEQRLPYHIVEAVDKALPVLLEEITEQLQPLVHEAVAREVDRRLPELLKQALRGAAPQADKL